MHKIRPFLWFNDNAEEAANYYVSTFKNSRIKNIEKYPEGSPGTPGTVMTVTFEIENQEFIALNGGPMYTFSGAISFMVDCVDQAEVDALWDKLADGGEPIQCGWVKDKFGITWQIVPKILGELLSGPDHEKSFRVMQAMLQMVKLDIETLKNA